ncbi:MAG: ribonuclease P protein component, partial [Desulfobacterales bacterium]
TVKAFCLKKGERLTRRSDFERLSRDGHRIDSDYFVILYRPNGLGRLRLGVTVSKRVGRAVIRNRLKRLVREHYRQHKGLFSDSYDVNVIAKRGAPDLSSGQIREALDAIVGDILRDCKHEAVLAGTH